MWVPSGDCGSPQGGLTAAQSPEAAACTPRLSEEIQAHGAMRGAQRGPVRGQPAVAVGSPSWLACPTPPLSQPRPVVRTESLGGLGD